MRKIIFLFFLCLCIQSCIRCYKEKEYLFEKSQYEEKINIIGIDDSFIIGTKLTFFIDKIIISKGLSLNNIKIYYKDEYLGEIKINKKLLEIPHEEEYTSDGKLIKTIELREELLRIIEKREKDLKINEYYMSEELAFKYEFYDEENNKNYNQTVHYRLSKHEKGCKKWIPSVGSSTKFRITSFKEIKV